MYSSRFDKTTFLADGIMGVGFQEFAPSGSVPLLQTLINQGRFTEPKFSLMLTTNESELFLGGFNSNRMKGDITYVPITDKVSVILIDAN